MRRADRTAWDRLAGGARRGAMTPNSILTPAGRCPARRLRRGAPWHAAGATGSLSDDAILAPLEAQFADQVRSKDRVRDLAEVFTHQREVDAMLDQIADAFTAVDVKFLEPASGSGNFLVEILRRKLKLIAKHDCVSQEQYEHRLLRAAASIYGVDISASNVAEARARMAHVLLEHYRADANTVEPTPGFLSAAALILGDNIVVGDTLDAGDKIELCDWQPRPGACFVRVWSYALIPPADRDLFWAERVQDPSPIHYSALAKGTHSADPKSEEPPVSAELTSDAGLREPQRVPDILDVIAALSSDAVPTPPLLARALLDILPNEVWSDPTLKWMDPATKSGSILREAARRLMDGLDAWEPDPAARSKHILTNMLYGCGMTQVHGEMSRRSVYVSRDATSVHAIADFDTPGGNIPFVAAEHDYPVNKQGRASGPCRVCGAPASLERGTSRENYAYAFIHGAYPTEEMKDMQFDVIVGNPPYQLGTEGFGATASNIYHRFVERAIALEPKYVAMIIPSRWFAGGKGLDEFRRRMIEDRRLRSIVDNPKLFDCFPGVEIKGGVNYFLWDRDHDGDCEFSTRVDGIIVSTLARDLREGDGVLVRDNQAMRIVRKVTGKSKRSIEELCTVTKPFGLTMRSNYPGSVPEPFEGAIPLIYASHVGYSRPDQIQRNHQWIDRWKVLLPRAGDGHGREVSYVIGEPIALAPGSACTQTYLITGMFDTADETENYAHYLTTKFVRFLILQRKVTQDVTPDRFRFVPMLDMKRRWTDEDLYKRFGLTKDEIAYIESTIHPREAILSLDSPIPGSHLPGGSKYRPPGQRTEEVEAQENGEDEE